MNRTTLKIDNMQLLISKKQALNHTPSPYAWPLKAPYIYALDLTTVCNNFCSGCANASLSREKTKRKERIEYMQDWKGLIDRIADHARLIRLTGGEPTLHREFKEIVEYINEKQIPFTLFTTGRWTVTKPQEIIEILKPLQYFEGMLVSLHGSTKETHHAFVESVDGAFDETCNNISLAAKAGLTVFTNAVITTWNASQIKDIFKLSMRLGAKYVVYNRYLGLPHPCEPSKETLRTTIRLIEEMKSEGFPCRFGAPIPQCFEPNTSPPTKSGYQSCNITPFGEVRPDNFITMGLGNIFKQTIEEIWSSPLIKGYRSFVPKDCVSCAVVDSCHGGATSVLIQHGLANDPLFVQPLSDYPLGYQPDSFENGIKYIGLSQD